MPVLGDDRGRRVPVEPDASARARRPADPAARRGAHAAAQPGVPARRVGLDGRRRTSCRWCRRRCACSPTRSTARDRVAIVVYAGASGLVLPSTPGDRKVRDSRRRIDGLEAGGSTNGAPGIQLAYDVAAEQLHQGRHQPRHPRDRRRLQRRRHERGRSDAPDRERARARRVPVRARRRHRQPQGLDDGEAGRPGQRQLRLPRHACTRRARCSSREAGATLVTVAKDVKIQVEFNPATVGAYRLIGYENRLLAERGLQQRHEGRRRHGRRASRDGAVRDRAGRHGRRCGWRGSAEVPAPRRSGWRERGRIDDREAALQGSGWRRQPSHRHAGSRIAPRMRPPGSDSRPAWRNSACCSETRSTRARPAGPRPPSSRGAIAARTPMGTARNSSAWPSWRVRWLGRTPSRGACVRTLVARSSLAEDLRFEPPATGAPRCQQSPGRPAFRQVCEETSRHPIATRWRLEVTADRVGLPSLPPARARPTSISAGPGNGSSGPSTEISISISGSSAGVTGGNADRSCTRQRRTAPRSAATHRRPRVTDASAELAAMVNGDEHAVAPAVDRGLVTGGRSRTAGHVGGDRLASDSQQRRRSAADVIGEIPERRRQIADDGGFVSGDIARIAVIEHHGVTRPKLPSRAHDGDRGPATAGMFGTCVERGLKAVGVEVGKRDR